ncbi:hypothetical protein [Sphingobacterium sp. 1.A.5]|uniref:hypothetical protein n=1 Tax=Sphingobacterium sp. 1.A.5 TaxID=2044604 RepID=UPI000C0C0D70|nr:hypothetical protein [Sphingobacterium sp. 1.A.5]
MSSLRIPDHLRPGFDNLLSLDNSNFGLLIDYIKSLTDFKNLEVARDLTKRFLSEVGIDESVNDVIYSLASLNARYPTKSMEEDLLESFKSFSESDSLDESLFKERVKELSDSSEALNKYLKKNILGSSYDKTLVYSEIITDIRLVFTSNLNDQSRSAIITHNLKLEVMDSIDNRDIYISMDSDSLVELKATIERALEKEIVIKNDYSNQISFL